VRHTLKANACDVVMGVPSGYEQTLTTKPYYRSTYVFVYPRSRGFAIKTLDDPALKKLKIGVHLLGDDYTNPPPVHELAKRGVQFVTEKTYPVIYDDISIELGYRVDLVVENAVIVEIKAVENLLPVHEAQEEESSSAHRVNKQN